jgi:hypothetical protein
MTYKTAWYVAHRIREAMREARDIQLGDPDTTVEIDEAYIGGRLRHKGSTVAKASKTMAIGLAERNWRVHQESMSNRKFEAINPVLDAKLAEVGLIAWDTKGKSVNWEEGTQQMMLKPDVYAAIQKSGIPAHVEIDLPNTDLYLKLGVVDGTSGKAGTLEVSLHPLTTASTSSVQPKTN